MKTVYFAIITLAAVAAFTSCKKDKTPEPEPEPGVLINGVRWAECNVDAPGTFVATPESPGMFYKWGSKVGWSATGDPTPSPAGSGAWADVVPQAGEGDWDMTNNNPCPTGWRVPTKEEQATLFDEAKVNKAWDESKKGYTFTNIASTKSIFFPAAGYRDGSVGTLNNVGGFGSYWSSTVVSAVGAWGLLFVSGGASQGNGNRTSGFTVRCVLQ